MKIKSLVRIVIITILNRGLSFLEYISDFQINKTKKTLIIGLGTGRCGTVSLKELLNLQKGANFSHESYPILPWKFSKNKIENKLFQILRKKNKYVGDIAFYYLPYVEYILSQCPSAKFICLKRDKTEVIKSYAEKIIKHNHWIRHNGEKWSKDAVWDACYPKYKAETKVEAIGLYWEDYYKQVENLMKKHPNNIHIWEMKKGLNTEKGVKEILDFVRIAERDKNYRVNVKKNTKETTSKA